MQDRLIEAVKKGLAGVLAYIMAGLAATVIAFIGLFFLFKGLAAWLVPEFGVAGAYLIAGAGAFLVAAILALLMYLVGRSSSGQKTEDPAPGAEEQAFELGMMGVNLLRDQVKAHPGKSTLLALVGGVVLGANPNLARSLVEVAKQLENSGEDDA